MSNLTSTITSNTDYRDLVTQRLGATQCAYAGQPQLRHIDGEKYYILNINKLDRVAQTYVLAILALNSKADNCPPVPDYLNWHGCVKVPVHWINVNTIRLGVSR